MGNVDDLFDKIMKMKLEDLLRMCATMIETNMDKKKSDVVFRILEMRLQKSRMAEQLGLKDD